jgi:hypothetical protein
MALTDQPYLPLYVDDWMNNNKLKVCSAGSHGLMISIMCLMHKEVNYGVIQLKDKFKITDNTVDNFAHQIKKQTSFEIDEVLILLRELVAEDVLCIDGEFLMCRRMVKRANISKVRSESGSEGGKVTQGKTKAPKLLVSI